MTQDPALELLALLNVINGLNTLTGVTWRDSFRLPKPEELRFTASPVRGEWSVVNRASGIEESYQNETLSTSGRVIISDFVCPRSLRLVFPHKLDLWGREDDSYRIAEVTAYPETLMIRGTGESGTRTASLSVTRGSWFPATYTEYASPLGEVLEKVRCVRSR